MKAEKAKALAERLVQQMGAQKVASFVCVSTDTGGTYQAWGGVSDFRPMVQGLLEGIVDGETGDDLCPACQEDLRRLKAALQAIRGTLGAHPLKHLH